MTGHLPLGRGHKKALSFALEKWENKALDRSDKILWKSC